MRCSLRTIAAFNLFETLRNINQARNPVSEERYKTIHLGPELIGISFSQRCLPLNTVLKLMAGFKQFSFLKI